MAELFGNLLLKRAGGFTQVFFPPETEQYRLHPIAGQFGQRHGGIGCAGYPPVFRHEAKRHTGGNQALLGFGVVREETNIGVQTMSKAEFIRVRRRAVSIMKKYEGFVSQCMGREGTGPRKGMPGRQG